MNQFPPPSVRLVSASRTTPRSLQVSKCASAPISTWLPWKTCGSPLASTSQAPSW